MITRRREVGQWLVFVAVSLLVVVAAYLLVAALAFGSSGCACTQASMPSPVALSG